MSNNKPEPDHAQYLEDVELWETKQLGADPKYARRVSREKEQEIDDSLGLQAISIRLQKELVDQIKELARQDGIGYQPYIRQLLTRHVMASRSVGEGNNVIP
jgi:predicted DNA binding CopG/RHH family protein